MKKLTGIILGIIGVVFVWSAAFGWCPYYPHAVGYNSYLTYQQPYSTVNLDEIKKQISEKQAELSVLFAQKNPDTQKINKLQEELRALYNQLNNQATYSAPSAYPYHHAGYPYCCPWGW